MEKHVQIKELCPNVLISVPVSRLRSLLACLSVCCVAASAAPFYSESKPFWSNPCGNAYFLDVIEEGTFHSEQITWHEQLTKSLRKVRHQLKMARDQLMYKDFDNLYIDVSRATELNERVRSVCVRVCCVNVFLLRCRIKSNVCSFHEIRNNYKH